MEQRLSVRHCEDGFLARPWLPPRAFIVFGAAAFRSGLALRARTKGGSGASARAAVNQALMSGGIAPQEWLRYATPSVMPFVGTQCKTDE